MRSFDVKREQEKLLSKAEASSQRKSNLRSGVRTAFLALAAEPVDPRGDGPLAAILKMYLYRVVFFLFPFQKLQGL